MKNVLLLVLLVVSPVLAEIGEVLFQDANWRVEQRGQVRVLLARQGGYWAEQSRMDAKAPSAPLLPYTRLQVNSAQAVSQPNRILVVGLGAASLTKSLRSRFPGAELVGIEIDPTVVRLARKYFDYREDSLTKTVIGDAREVMAGGRLGKFDLIYLDAFDGTEIPEPLRQVEFFDQVAAHLAPRGAVITNLHQRSKKFNEDLQRLGKVFPFRYGKQHMVQTMVVAAFEPLQLTDWRPLKEEESAHHGYPDSAQHHRQ